MPGPQRTSDLTILIAAGIATIFLSALSFVLAPVESTPAIDGSSFSAHPGGARATYLALKQAGYRVERTFEPLAELRRLPSDSILVLANPIVAPSQQDLRSLAQFVEGGGLLLAAVRGAVPFLPGQPFRAGGSPPAGESRAAASMVSPLSRGAPEIQMTAPLFSLAPDAAYVPVYGDSARPYVITAAFASGRVIWWAGEGPMTNAGIAQPGHAELLLNAVGPPSRRLLLWDEHYHGHTRSLWSYLAHTPLPYAGAQLGFVFVAALLAFSRRRGPVRAHASEPRTSPLEFVESVGALYERAGIAPGAIAVVRSRLRHALIAACGLPASASDEHLSRAAAARLSMTPGELGQLLETSRTASQAADLRAEDARAIVAALQSAAARLHQINPRAGRAGGTAAGEKVR